MYRQKLELLATATGCLTPRQLRLIGGTLEELDRLERRQTAILAALRCLPVEVQKSRWQSALALETGLKRIQGVSGRRILSGARLPTALETALLAMLAAGGPKCREKIYLELTERGQ